MKISHRCFAFCSFALAACLSLPLIAAAQQQPIILQAPDAAKILPDAVFFAGQSANTQLRNAAGVRFADNHVALAVLVDTSGYSTAVQQKYQGYLITEVALDIQGQRLVPGAYGFGFVGDHFLIMDVGNHDVMQASTRHESAMPRPMPLQILTATEPGEYRLCSSRDCVLFRHAH